MVKQASNNNKTTQKEVLFTFNILKIEKKNS